MMKLSLKKGERLNIGEDVKIIYSKGNGEKITLQFDAPKELIIARSTVGGNIRPREYEPDQMISNKAKKKIQEVLKNEKVKISNDIDNKLE